MRKPSAKVQVPCLQCGKTIEAYKCKAREYCSKSCSMKSRASKSRGGTLKKICPSCKQEFTARRCDIKNGAGIHCSRKCRDLAKVTQVACICLKCGITFYVNADRAAKGWGKYCSRTCKHTAAEKQIQTTCKQCGKSFMYRQSRVHQYCSRKCMGRAASGVNSVFWRGGSKKSRGENWNSQRKLAFERDGGVCQICHVKSKVGQRRNSVHHIKPFREFDGDYITANDLSNLITLCEHCHPKAERGKIAVPKHLL